MISENKDKPLVSVIVRTKDRPHLLRRALRSILQQTYRPLEVVLINDGGREITQIQQKFRRYFPIECISLNPSQGRAFSGNAGLKAAKGEYICFLDDDDIFYKNHLKGLVKALIETNYRVAYSDYVTVWMRYNNKTGRFRQIRNTSLNPFESLDFSYQKLKIENYIPLNSLLFKNSILKESGGFDNELSDFEDWELLLRIAAKTSFYHLKEKTCAYFYWDKNYRESYADSYRKIVRKHFSGELDDYLIETWCLMYKRILELNADTLRLYNKPFNRMLDFFISVGRKLKK
ncbi:MAG: glycosyltransferase family 2 protein [Candidatus Omnitrophica bacterium]|jgi:glycosyltransferase involved in cell wall biosynthesis|nr:glycosyltransferase family 2 protein [Candidatus Omnitrophota bacterium]